MADETPLPPAYIRGTAAELRAARARWASLDTAAALTEAAGHDVAGRLRADADTAGAVVFLYEVECILGPQRHTYLAAAVVGDPAGGIARTGLCGPCNASTTAEVLAAGDGAGPPP